MIDINMGLWIIALAIMILFVSFIVTAGSCLGWLFSFSKYVSLTLIIIGSLIVIVSIIQFCGVI